MSDDNKDEEALLTFLARNMPPPRAPDVHNHIKVESKPHDAADAARLYGQLLEKARAEVLASVRVTDTKFECVIDSALDNMSGEMKYRAIFSLNGSPKMTADISVDSRTNSKVHEVFQKLADKTAKVIATEILRPLFTKIHFERFK